MWAAWAEGCAWAELMQKLGVDIQKDQLTASQNLIMTVGILGLVHAKKTPKTTQN